MWMPTGWNIPSVSCHLHTAVHYQWFHQWLVLPTRVRPPTFQISRWLQLLFLLPQRRGSESRPTTQLESSDGGFWAGIGAICWAPIPGADIQGCYFHFLQCLWRKVQALGLTDLYKNDPVTRRTIHSWGAALAFVPLAFVRITWTSIEAAPQPLWIHRDKWANRNRSHNPTIRRRRQAKS